MNVVFGWSKVKFSCFLWFIKFEVNFNNFEVIFSKNLVILTFWSYSLNFFNSLLNFSKHLRLFCLNLQFFLGYATYDSLCIENYSFYKTLRLFLWNSLQIILNLVSRLKVTSKTIINLKIVHLPPSLHCPPTRSRTLNFIFLQRRRHSVIKDMSCKMLKLM